MLWVDRFSSTRNPKTMKRHLPVFAILFCTVAALSFFQAGFAFCENESYTDITLISPFPGIVTVGKKPVISFRSSQPLYSAELLILLDGDDITALVSHQNKLFSYTPIHPLRAGDHTIQIFGYQTDGTSVQKELFFSSRHSNSFEEVYSTNRISSTVKTVLNKDTSSSDTTQLDPSADTPYTSFDNYLTSDSNIKEGNWVTSLQANARYYDQNAALLEPEKKGVSLIDFLATASYSGKNYSALTEVGDTTIEESQNTIDYLTRRGGKASFTIGNITINGFGTLSTESGYEIDGLGFGFNSNDHIMGTSAKIDFFDRRISLKGIYSRGGETGNSSFGTWSMGGGRKGDVTGIILKSDFFEQIFSTDFEFDTSSYDSDTDDDIAALTDKAYRIKVSGLVEKYDYELSYYYSGPQYDVVGNQSIVKDRAGSNFSGGVTYPNHAIRLIMNYSWDNVESDDFFPRIYSFTSGVDYQYSGWQKFPVNLLFEHNSQDSTDEPADTDSTALDTSTLTGSVGYNDGPWAVEFRSSYSEQNDTTHSDYDTQLFTFSAVPSYSASFFSILPSWTLNSSIDQTTDVRTDINTLTLDIYSSFLKNTIICELGGTYDWTTADDSSIDIKNTAIYGRINYHLEQLWWLENPTVALEYQYNLQEDIIEVLTTRENTVTLVISTALPFSF